MSFAKENKEFEEELRSEWSKWQAKSHPEDCMPFIEYVESLGSHKGHDITVDSRSVICRILFKKR